MSKSPDWWHVYNDVKHNFSDNFGNATLQNTRNALAGAFLLNVVHIPAYIRLIEYRVVTPQAKGEGHSVFTLTKGWKENLKEKMRKKGIMLGFIETSLFRYDYQKKEKAKSST